MTRIRRDGPPRQPSAAWHYDINLARLIYDITAAASSSGISKLAAK
jgi:hypothetical protein